LPQTYATRFSHTARRWAAVISTLGLGGEGFIEGGGGRTSENVHETKLDEAEGAFEVISAGALNAVDAAGRAGLLRELSFLDKRSSEPIFDSGGLESLLGGTGSGWRGYERGRSFEDVRRGRDQASWVVVLEERWRW